MSIAKAICDVIAAERAYDARKNSMHASTFHGRQRTEEALAALLEARAALQREHSAAQ